MKNSSSGNMCTPGVTESSRRYHGLSRITGYFGRGKEDIKKNLIKIFLLACTQVRDTGNLGPLKRKKDAMNKKLSGAALLNEYRRV